MKTLLFMAVAIGLTACGKDVESTSASALAVTNPSPTPSTIPGTIPVTSTTPTPSTGFSCRKTSGGLTFAYSGTTLPTGDVFVECEIAGSAVGTSSSHLYGANQTGASTKGCQLVWDSDSSNTSGWWYFTADSGIKAVYNDVGSSINGSTVTFGSSDCGTF